MQLRAQFAHELHLFSNAGHSRPALPPRRWPARLGNPNGLACKGLHQMAVDRQHVRHRLIEADGHILPVGQHMRGHHIHLGGQHRGMAQPELPHIGVCDRHRRPLSCIAQNRRQVLGAALLAQEHLVAQHQQAHGVGVRAGQRDRPVHFLLAAHRISADPSALHHRQPQWPGQRGDAVLTVVCAVGADATGPLSHQPKVFEQVRIAELQLWVQRRVAIAPKGRVRQTGQALGRHGGPKYRHGLRQEAKQTHQQAAQPQPSARAGTCRAWRAWLVRRAQVSLRRWGCGVVHEPIRVLRPDCGPLR